MPDHAQPGFLHTNTAWGSRLPGVVRPQSNMDSGGPALVCDGNQWAVAGVVSGPDESGKTLSTDVVPHARLTPRHHHGHRRAPMI
ncbi:hypothetical protein AQJ46_50015 [Streptomyces canus]|uniref:Uncharacterized protein n=1 Tax=Streptomyces canus TaxID=58343 RepID=A0A117QVW8_9ACTN|nr:MULTISPECIES: hypothetical protein [Streptomyces]KUN54003.1 hypothetical protein AQJ46_50015 [Streptomyces canus]MDI5909792.1 hypothetical protein [Streptomyces sp. 12257]